jgi:hypothetical protein
MPVVASAKAAIDHAARCLDEIRRLKLAARIADEELGGLLTDIEIGHVLAIVRSIEEPRRRRVPEAIANGNGDGSGPQQQVTP